MPDLKLAVFVLLGACASTGSRTTAAAARDTDSRGTQSPTGSATDAFVAAHGEYFRRSILHPLINLDASFGSDGEVEDEPLVSDVAGLALDVFLTPPVDRDSFLIAGGLAEVRRFQFRGVPAVADESLYAFALRLGYGTFLTEDLVVQAFWEPSMYSDLDGTLTADDYQLGNGVVLAYHRQSANLFWKYGLAVTAASDAGFAPILGAVWHLDGAWVLDVLLPVKIDLHHRPTADWDITAGAHLRANRYHVRGPANTGAPQNDIDLTEVVGFVAARHRLDAHVSTELEIGSVIGGSYDLGYGNGQPDHGGTLKPALFVRWQLSWDF